MNKIEVSIKTLLLASIVVLFISCKNTQNAEGVITENIVEKKFQPNWESLEKAKPAKWWDEGKKVNYPNLFLMKSQIT